MRAARSTHSHAHSARGASRRTFIQSIPYLVTAGFIYPIGKFLFFTDTPQRRFSLPIKEIRDGITYLQAGELFVVKEKEKLLVFDAHCTHMGCLLHFDAASRQFACPCHKSRFDHDGRRLRGPAKRDLDTIAYTIKNRTLRIG